MTVLSVNLNKVALLRNARTLDYPSVTAAARMCIQAGAGGITVHPRPDQRHIRPKDVYDLAAMTKDVEFNIEGNPFPEFMELVRATRPTQCTLVPDSPEQSTSDHGWDLRKEGERLKPIIRELQDLGIRTALFMDPEPDQFELAKSVGADRIELYTETYARAFSAHNYRDTLQQFRVAAEKAQAAGLGVNAGHDLNLDNLGTFCSIPGILECSIGHALIADAVFMGLENAVRAYVRILDP